MFILQKRKCADAAPLDATHEEKVGRALSVSASDAPGSWGIPGNSLITPVLSTGVLWPVDALYRKHKFLRKLQEPVRFHLVFFPYWLGVAQGSAKGRWFPGRRLEHVKVLDALSGRTFLVPAQPDTREEAWEWLPPPPDAPDLRPARVYSPSQPLLPLPPVKEKLCMPPSNAELDSENRGPVQERAALQQEANYVDVAHLEAPAPHLDQDEALRLLSASVLDDWKRRFNKPFRPEVTLTLLTLQVSLIRKPYWMMTPEDARLANPDDLHHRLFVFDATTGLGGLAQFRPVVEYWWMSRGYAWAKDEK